MLQAVTDALLDSAEAVEARLLEEGLTRRRFRLEGLETAAKLLGRAVPFVLQTVHGESVALPIRSEDVAQQIVRVARKTISRWGAATVADVAAQVSERKADHVSVDVVARVLTAEEDFRWLDKAGGWFWLISVPRNRLRNQIRKVLAVAGRIHVAELRSGVSRHHRSAGVAPPRRVLTELCRQMDGCRVEDGLIITDPPLDWRGILAETEQTRVRVLTEFGPVMRRSELEGSCLATGMKRSTFYAYLDNSPVLTKYASGVYGLRGAVIPPGIVESLAIRRRRNRVLVDFGWTPDQRIWLGYRISRAMLVNGTMIIPAAMEPFVSGEFNLKTVDGSLAAKRACQAASGGRGKLPAGLTAFGSR